MIHKFVLASLCITTTLATAVSPAHAGGWVYRGRRAQPSPIGDRGQLRCAGRRARIPMAALWSLA